MLPQEKQGFLYTLDGVCLFYNHGMSLNFSVINLPVTHRDLHRFLLRMLLKAMQHDQPFIVGYSSSL